MARISNNTFRLIWRSKDPRQGSDDVYELLGDRDSIFQTWWHLTRSEDIVAEIWDIGGTKQNPQKGLIEGLMGFNESIAFTQEEAKRWEEEKRTV
jgi:hypothetical protein